MPPCSNCGSDAHDTADCKKRKTPPDRDVGLDNEDRVKRPRNEGPALRYAPPAQAAPSIRVAATPSLQSTIRRTHAGIGQMQQYTTSGEQSAITWVRRANGKPKKFRTTDRMHSEMRAIEFMLNHGEWVLHPLGLILTNNHERITVPDEIDTDQMGSVINMDGDFYTGIPHCGFCTFMLSLLGLPLCQPTSGNHGGASGAMYPLPAAIRDSRAVLVRALGHFGGEYFRLKPILNGLVRLRPDEWVMEAGGGFFDDGSILAITPGMLETEEPLVGVDGMRLPGQSARQFVRVGEVRKVVIPWDTLLEKAELDMGDLWKIVWQVLCTENSRNTQTSAPARGRRASLPEKKEPRK